MGFPEVARSVLALGARNCPLNPDLLIELAMQLSDSDAIQFLKEGVNRLPKIVGLRVRFAKVSRNPEVRYRLLRESICSFIGVVSL